MSRQRVVPFVSGGHLANVPKPYRRMFHDKRLKRTVTARVMQFVGLGRHFHVSLTQEDNPILDECGDPPFIESPCWRLAWDDEDGRGIYITRKFSTWERAMVFIEKTCAKKFPGHRIERQYDESTHVYKTEGD